MTHTHVRKEATPMTDTTPPVALTLPSGQLWFNWAWEPQQNAKLFSREP